MLTVTAWEFAEAFLTAVWMNTLERPIAMEGTTADVTLVAANDDVKNATSIVETKTARKNTLLILECAPCCLE